MAYKVLVVDDDADILSLVRIVLAEEGYDVAVAPNGREALAHLKTNTPHLILLDLAMPVMNGWEFLTAVQGDHLASKTAVVIMTASPRSEESLKRPPVVGYLPKPFDLDDLVRCAAHHSRPLSTLAAS
jgi:CheY-like chemotaxis protein